MPEYEDMLVPSDCGDGEERSSGSEEDSEMMSTESDAMDIGNVSRVLRGEMPELTGAEEMAKAELAWELIYKLGNYSKWEWSPETLPRTPGTHLPGHSLTQSSLYNVDEDESEESDDMDTDNQIEGIDAGLKWGKDGWATFDIMDITRV